MPPLGTWLTLEWVLSDYEQKRNAGHPEFCDGHARIATQAQRNVTGIFWIIRQAGSARNSAIK